MQLTRGCPEISREDALGLIKDLEGPADPANLEAVQAKESTSEVMWLERLLEDHPVFEGMPQHLKHKMLDTPAKDLSALGINKRVRKRIKNGGGGAVVHLYAGPDRGFTLKRAMKEAGGDTTVLLEYDTKRDPSHDTLPICWTPTTGHGWSDGCNLGRTKLQNEKRAALRTEDWISWT